MKTAVTLDCAIKFAVQVQNSVVFDATFAEQAELAKMLERVSEQTRPYSVVDNKGRVKIFAALRNFFLPKHKSESQKEKRKYLNPHLQIFFWPGPSFLATRQREPTQTNGFAWRLRWALQKEAPSTDVIQVWPGAAFKSHTWLSDSKPTLKWETLSY